MKKLFTLTLCCLFMMLSCRKEEAPGILPGNPATEKLQAALSNALKGYENSFNKGRLQTLMNTLDWSRVYTKTIAGSDYSFIALNEPMKGFGFKPGQYREYLQFSGNEESGYALELVSVYAENARAFFEKAYEPMDVKQPRKRLGEAFSGTVNSYRLSTFDLNVSYYYQAGELKSSKAVRSGGRVVDKVQSLAVVECTDWWLDTIYYINGIPVVTQTTYLYRTCNGICEEQTTFAPGANFESLPKVMCGGGIGNGNNQIIVLPYVNRVYDSNLPYCMRSVIMTARTNSTGNVSFALESFIGNSPTHDWIISTGSLAATKNAVTYGSNGKVYTTIDRSKFTAATDVAVARTLIHEAIHGHFLVYPINPNNPSVVYQVLFDEFIKSQDLNQAHHQQLAEMFIQDIGTTLKRMFPNLTGDPDYFNDMAWGGLTNTSYFQALPQATKTRISNRLSIEQSGYDLNNNSSAQIGNPSGC